MTHHYDSSLWPRDLEKKDVKIIACIVFIACTAFGGTVFSEEGTFLFSFCIFKKIRSVCGGGVEGYD